MKIQPNLNSILIPAHLKDNFRPANDDIGGRVVAEASSSTTNNVAASEIQSKTLWCFTFRVNIIAKGTFKVLLYWYYFSIKWTVIIKLAVANKLQNYFFCHLFDVMSYFCVNRSTEKEKDKTDSSAYLRKGQLCICIVKCIFVD